MLFAEKNQNSPVSVVRVMPLPAPLVPWDGTCHATVTLKRLAFKQRVVPFATHVSAEAEAGATRRRPAPRRTCATSGAAPPRVESLRRVDRGMLPPVTSAYGSN